MSDEFFYEDEHEKATRDADFLFRIVETGWPISDQVDDNAESHDDCFRAAHGLLRDGYLRTTDAGFELTRAGESMALDCAPPSHPLADKLFKIPF